MKYTTLFLATTAATAQLVSPPALSTQTSSQQAGASSIPPGTQRNLFIEEALKAGTRADSSTCPERRAVGNPLRVPVYKIDPKTKTAVVDSYIVVQPTTCDPK